MDLHISDEFRRQLAVLVGVALMAAAALSAAALAALGRETGAQAALGVALAASFPVLAGTAILAPAAGRRSVRIVLAAASVVTLLSLALTHAPSPGA